MRSIISILKNILINMFSSITLPLADTFQVVANLVSKILNIEYEQLNKMTKELDIIIKKNMYYSLIIYYLFLLIMEIYILINILGGKITYYSFWTLLSYSFAFITYTFIFVIFLNNRFKSRNFNFIIYFQLLFLLPLGVVYWIASIEGHNIYLKDLNSDQWISLFNTIIIYFSGCLIGIITLYKNKEVSNEKRTKKAKRTENCI